MIEPSIRKLIARELRRYRRARPGYIGKLEAKHGRHVGEVVIAWNGLQASLFMIFWAVIKTNHATALGIWHTIQSDKTQREILEAATRGTFEEKSRTLISIVWLLKAAQALSPHRNDSAHTHMMPMPLAAGGGLTPSAFAAREAAADRLLNFPLERIWRRVRGDLHVLAAYGNAVAHAINSPDAAYPWPRRPRLLAVRVTSGKATHKRRRQSRAKPRPPPKS